MLNLDDWWSNLPIEHYCSNFLLHSSADNVLWWSSSPGLVDGLAWNMYLIMFVYLSGWGGAWGSFHSWAFVLAGKHFWLAVQSSEEGWGRSFHPWKVLLSSLSKHMGVIIQDLERWLGHFYLFVSFFLFFLFFFFTKNVSITQPRWSCG